jgi:hypothetical protein
MKYEIEPTQFTPTVHAVSEPELRQYEGEEHRTACVELYNHCGILIGEVCVDILDDSIADIDTLREYVLKQLGFMVPIETNKTYNYTVITL